MNQYLTKDQHEAISSIFQILRARVDLHKRMGFDYLSSNVKILKFGNQEERLRMGFMQLESDALGDDENSNLDSQEKDKEEESVEETEESDSDLEQIELNRRLKEGQSGAQGVRLGDDSLQNNALFVMSKQDNLNDFEKEEMNAPDFIAQGFQSFEMERPVESSASNHVNPIFQNKIPGEEDSEIRNTSVHSNNVFIGEDEHDTQKSLDKQSEEESHVIQIPSDQNAGEMESKLSFCNQSFHHDCEHSSEEVSKEVLKRSSFGGSSNTSKKIEELPIGNESSVREQEENAVGNQPKEKLSNRYMIMGSSENNDSLDKR